MGWITQQADIHFTEVIWYDERGNKRILQIDADHPEYPDDETKTIALQQIFVTNAADQVEIVRAARDPDNPLQLIWQKETSRAEYERGRKVGLTFWRRDKGKEL